MVDNSNIKKTDYAFFFSGKLISAQIWAKSAQNGPKIGFFRFFEKCCHDSLS